MRLYFSYALIVYLCMCSTCSVLPVCTCQHFPESFKDFTKKSLIGSLSWRHKFLEDYTLTVKKKKGFLILAFLGRGEFAVCHSRPWRFVSGSYSKIHDSSPVITQLKNFCSLSRRSRKSRQSSLRLAFYSFVRFFGTILAHTFLIYKSCVKI